MTPTALTQVTALHDHKMRASGSRVEAKELTMRTYLLLLFVAVAPILFELIDRAARRAGCAQKELALSQGMSLPQWSRQIHGLGHVSLARLWDTPPAFRLALLEELAAAWDAPRPAHTIDDVYRLLLSLVPRRMARAAWATSDVRQEAVCE